MISHYGVHSRNKPNDSLIDVQMYSIAMLKTIVRISVVAIFITLYLLFKLNCLFFYLHDHLGSFQGVGKVRIADLIAF